MKTAKLSAGFFLGILAAILAAAGAYLNTGVSGNSATVTVLLAAGAVLEVVAIVLAKSGNAIGNVVGIVNTLLFTAALALAFAPQVNQIANVVSGLDQLETLNSFITYGVVNGIAILLAMVESFTGKVK